MIDESNDKLRSIFDEAIGRLQRARDLLEQRANVFEVITELSGASGTIEGMGLYLWTEDALKEGSARALRIHGAIKDSESELGPGSTLLQNWAHIRWRRRELFEDPVS